MKTTISVVAICDFIVLCCVFLAALDFVNRYYYFMFAAVGIMFLTPGRKFRATYSTAFLLLLAVSMFLFDPNSRSSFTNMVRPFTFFLAYTLGISYIKREKTLAERESSVTRLLLIIVAGTMIHYALNLAFNVGSQTRNTIDFWTRNILSATGQAALAVLGVGVVAAVMFSGMKRKYKILAFCATAIIITYNIILAGRTLLYLLIIALTVAFLHYSYHYKRTILTSILFWGTLILVLAGLYSVNAFGIRTAFESSNLYQRFFGYNAAGLMDDTRWMLKQLYVEHMLEYPFGGSHIWASYLEYAHDLYLDTYDMAGVFALLAIILFVGASLWRLGRLLRREDISFQLRQLLLCVYLVINIEFWIEPIMLGVPWLFMFYCMMDGMLTYLLTSPVGKDEPT